MFVVKVGFDWVGVFCDFCACHGFYYLFGVCLGFDFSILGVVAYLKGDGSIRGYGVLYAMGDGSIRVCAAAS